MKTQTKLVLFTAGFAGLLLCVAPGSQAQELPVRVSALMRTQGNTVNNGTTTATGAPHQSALTTGALLRQLATDEHALGNYTSDSFPAGSRLAFSNTNGFEVVDAQNNPVLSVSNLLSLDTLASVSFAGRTNNSDGAGRESELEAVLLSYNASTNSTGTNTPVVFNFVVLGSATADSTLAFSANGRRSVGTESFYLRDGVGAGTNADGVPMVLTGFTLVASGRTVTTTTAAVVSNTQTIPAGTSSTNNSAVSNTSTPPATTPSATTTNAATGVGSTNSTNTVSPPAPPTP